jgi:hypothetical protein
MFEEYISFFLPPSLPPSLPSPPMAALQTVLDCRDLLSLVLSFLSLADRLTRTALVSKEWNACAHSSGACHTMTIRDWPRLRAFLAYNVGDTFETVITDLDLCLELPTNMQRLRSLVTDAACMTIAWNQPALMDLYIVDECDPYRLTYLLTNNRAPNLTSLTFTSAWWGSTIVHPGYAFSLALGRLLRLEMCTRRFRGAGVESALTVCPNLTHLALQVGVMNCEASSVCVLPSSPSLIGLELVTYVFDDVAEPHRRQQEFMAVLGTACPNLETFVDRIDLPDGASLSAFDNVSYVAFPRLTALHTSAHFTSDATALGAFPPSLRSLTVTNNTLVHMSTALGNLPNLTALCMRDQLVCCPVITTRICDILLTCGAQLRVLKLCMGMDPHAPYDFTESIGECVAACTSLCELGLAFFNDVDPDQVNRLIREVVCNIGGNLTKLSLALPIAHPPLHDETAFAIGEHCTKLAECVLRKLCAEVVTPIATRQGMRAIVAGCHALRTVSIPMQHDDEVKDVCDYLATHCPQLESVYLPCHAATPACVRATLPHVSTMHAT